MKVVQIVCCKPTKLQKDLYRLFVQSKSVKTVLRDGTKSRAVLPLINNLKRLCNHPKLVSLLNSLSLSLSLSLSHDWWPLWNLFIFQFRKQLLYIYGWLDRCLCVFIYVLTNYQVYDAMLESDQKDSSTRTSFKGAKEVFPKDFSRNGHNPHYSGKMSVLNRLLAYLKKHTKDRVVIVSNYTSTLNIFEK